MGFSMVTLSGFVIIQQHFKKYRPLAAAISASGISLGSLCSGPLLTAMLDAFQWRGTLLLMSGMVFNCCVFGALYRSPPTQSQNGSVSSHQLLRDLTNSSIFSNTPFTLVCVGSFLMNLGLMVFMQHTPSRAVVIGIKPRLAYLLPTVTGVAVLAGRLIGGFIGNLPRMNRVLQFGVNIIICGFLLVLLGQIFSFAHLAVFGAAAGLVTGMSCLGSYQFFFLFLVRYKLNVFDRLWC